MGPICCTSFPENCIKYKKVEKYEMSALLVNVRLQNKLFYKKCILLSNVMYRFITTGYVYLKQ